MRLRADVPFSELPMYTEVTPCDPDDYNPAFPLDWSQNRKKRAVAETCFTPSVPSVITVSAPQVLLSASLVALLIALGIYFGFVWTRNLDTDAGHNDSRNVFITYIVGLAVSGLVYSISSLIQNVEKQTELQIIENYMAEYMQNHPESVERWGLTKQEPETDGAMGIADADAGNTPQTSGSTA